MIIIYYVKYLIIHFSFVLSLEKKNDCCKYTCPRRGSYLFYFILFSFLFYQRSTTNSIFQKRPKNLNKDISDNKHNYTFLKRLNYNVLYLFIFRRRKNIEIYVKPTF